LDVGMNVDTLSLTNVLYYVNVVSLLMLMFMVILRALTIPCFTWTHKYQA